MKRLATLCLATLLLMPAAHAEDEFFDPDYQGSEVVSDGKGQVHVKVVFFPNEDCWSFAGLREGVPDKVADQPTERHLYVTVNVAKTKPDCHLTNAFLQDQIVIPDKKGKISLDIFFVDERGVLVRSQRHRIQRDTCTASC
jgi:hypothetical protein